MEKDNNIINVLKNITYTEEGSIKCAIATSLLHFYEKEDITKINIKLVAKHSNTSVSSITKFCKNCNFTGWKELHYVLKMLQNKHINNNYINLFIKNNMLSKNIFAFKNIIYQNINTINDVINKILLSKEVIIVNDGKFLNTILNFYDDLKKMHFNVQINKFNDILKFCNQEVVSPNNSVFIFVYEDWYNKNIFHKIFKNINYSFFIYKHNVFLSDYKNKERFIFLDKDFELFNEDLQINIVFSYISSYLKNYVKQKSA